MQRRRFVAGCLTAGCLAGVAPWGSSSAHACLHGGKGDSLWKQTDQEAIAFWRKGRQELVLSMSYQAVEPKNDPNSEQPAKPGQALPADFGWVIPVPTPPDKYGVLEPKVFELAAQLADRFQKPLPKPKFGNGIGGGGGGFFGGVGGVEVVHHTQVGEYDITALKGRGPQAATEVNAWLAKNDYLGIPVADMEFYTAKGWTFLAVKVSGGKGEKLAESGKLRPLHMSFASDRIYWPLKLSLRPGLFSVRAYVFSEGGIQFPAWLKERGLEIQTWHHGQYGSAPVSMTNLRFDNFGYQNPLANLWAEVQKGPLGRLQRPFFTVIGGTVNNDDRPISGWKTDFELSTRA